MDICIYTCICGLRVHADMFAWAVSVSDSHMSLGCSSTYLYDTYICMPAQFCWRKCNVSLATCINVYVHAYLCTCFPVNAHRYQTKILCVSFHLAGRSFAAFSVTIGMAREGFPQKKLLSILSWFPNPAIRERTSSAILIVVLSRKAPM